MNIFNKYLCLEVFKGRKENVKEGMGRRNYSPCLGVEKPTRKEIDGL
jgi:hypothetical protein